ncbi:zinc-binding dehydrogenase [Streptomyces sp. NBC_01220]|uniref:quinone oxidoreductase family protein n=1 Tax=Streptomyces TaxID=1883 RepID=UPI001C5F16BE|nr:MULTISPECIES: zinc-binding dehydrogenase [Streptomyces]MBW5254535.1 zinc-binding dehydrogenase [Streptomyces poriferorum]MBW5262355.1 zinc-binding dehydrogenase [Streptomyces poriferorum]WSI66358.1 zinc-binding dehydrogenase [Streptomyces sp. NBC_01336]WSQ43195.1 zinc-binding dehydrogenase [Streptomyces sp. NBC_01220]
MRRVRYYEYGDPDVLTIEEAEIPTPGPGQVLIRAEAIGANFVDTKFRRGPSSGAIFQRPLPGKLTGDVVGTVEAAGLGVDTQQVGRRVAGLAEDAFADYIVTDAQWLAPIPDGLDLGAASMLPMGAPVALRTLRTGRLAPGETVLIHAAAGGIGHLAVQLAKLLGAGTVIATAGSPAKLDFARKCGADIAIDYTDSDWPDQVRKAAPRGVDVVLDSVGGETLQRSFDVLAPFGRIVIYGAASGELTSLPVTNLFALKSVAGFSLIAWRAADPEQARREMTEVAEYSTAGQLHTAVHARLPLAEAAAAHRLLEDRSQLGRVLLLP